MKHAGTHTGTPTHIALLSSFFHQAALVVLDQTAQLPPFLPMDASAALGALSRDGADKRQLRRLPNGWDVAWLVGFVWLVLVWAGISTPKLLNLVVHGLYWKNQPCFPCWDLKHKSRFTILLMVFGFLVFGSLKFER